jgi:hypothetical protein
VVPSNQRPITRFASQISGTLLSHPLTLSYIVSHGRAGVRQERHETRALDRLGNLCLLLCAQTGALARVDLSVRSHKAAQIFGRAEIDETTAANAFLQLERWGRGLLELGHAATNLLQGSWMLAIAQCPQQSKSVAKGTLRTE